MCIFAFCFALFSVASAAQGASLYFSSPSGSYTVGSALSVSVYVSSADQAMNAASGVISFSQDTLEVTSLSKSGSIFTLWVQEPSFSNSAGAVNFEGIVLNPGFTGADGKIITINFRVKAAGAALVSFSSGSVLANDGSGTNILTSLGNAQFNLGDTAPSAPAVPETITPSAVSGAPSAPKISSPTHPDPNKWYSKKDAKFTWSLPNGVTAVRLLYDKSPHSQPTVLYTSPIAEKEINDIKDGISYFHVQLENKSGWGGVSHFRFQIDTQPPEPMSIRFVDGDETENPRPVVIFSTTDSLSGIGYYTIKIGEGDFFSVAPEIVESNPYTLHPQDPGKRTILIQAFDKAENHSTATKEFTITPLETPVFTEYQKELESGEVLTVKGESRYPNAQIMMWLQREEGAPKSFTIESGQDGKFIFMADEKLQDGMYTLWAEVVDARGAKSLPTEKITITVVKPVFFRRSWNVGFLAMIIPLIALIAALLFVLWYGWQKFLRMRKRLLKEMREAESALHKAFDILKENIREHIKEEKMIKQLKRDLDNAEKRIREEIEDIEKEVLS